MSLERIVHVTLRWEYSVERRQPGDGNPNREVEAIVRELVSESRCDGELYRQLAASCGLPGHGAFDRTRVSWGSDAFEVLREKLLRAAFLDLRVRRSPRVLFRKVRKETPAEAWFRNPIATSARSPRVVAWVDLRICDQDESPVPRRAYRIVGAEGDEVSGFVGDDGCAHVPLKSEGAVKLTLSDLTAAELRRDKAIEGRRADDTGPVVGASGDGLVHTVEQGETLIAIADRYHYVHWVPIWNHPSNKALRDARDNPQCLVPGDELLIPTRLPVEAREPSQEEHTYRVQVSKPSLRVRVVLADRSVVTLEPDALEGEGVGTPVVSGEVLAAPCAPTCLKAAVRLPTARPDDKGDGDDTGVATATLALEIGTLPPIGERSGVLARLSNLGYAAGDDDTVSDEALTLAIEEFQHEHGAKPVGKRDADFLKKLLDAHGQ